MSDRYVRCDKCNQRVTAEMDDKRHCELIDALELSRAAETARADVAEAKLRESESARNHAEKLAERYREALEFYANMDHQVPGTDEWDTEVLDMLGQLVPAKVTSWNKPSKYAKDMGQRARQALASADGSEGER